jgi:hypothetical protein
MKRKYKRGKFPYTVKDTETGKLYVRKSVSVEGGKQKQIWRICQPATAKRFIEVLAEIEREIISQNNR